MKSIINTAKKILTNTIEYFGDNPQLCPFNYSKQNKCLEELLKLFHKNEKASTFWVHATSLEEYSLIRPIIKRLKDSGCRVIVTFISQKWKASSELKNEGIDYLCCLPKETQSNVKAFLDAVNPNVAIFACSKTRDIYQKELGNRQIPYYFLPILIESYGNIAIDSAFIKTKIEWRDRIIERFCVSSDRVFLAANINDTNELKMIAKLANRNPLTKFLIIPYKISLEILNKIKYEIRGNSICYNECSELSDVDNCQCLIIDFLGTMPNICRFANMAFVGRDTNFFLQDVIEASVYGIPVSYISSHHANSLIKQEIKHGTVQNVSKFSQLESWFSLYLNEQNLLKVKTFNKDYVSLNIGAIERIMNIIRIN